MKSKRIFSAMEAALACGAVFFSTACGGSNVNTYDSASNEPPTASADSYTVDEDVALTVDAQSGVLANDVDADNVSLSAVIETQPTNGTLTLQPDGSFVYAPNDNFDSVDEFTYRASDGDSLSPPATVSITVTPVPDSPLSMGEMYSLDEDGVLVVDSTIGVLANDEDPDGDVITAVLDTTTAYGALTLNTDGSFSYTPDAEFNGADTFDYHADDGALTSGLVTVTIDVVSVNDPPTGNADSYAAVEDVLLQVTAAAGVLINDNDVDGDTLTVSVVDAPARGALVLQTDGAFAYLSDGDLFGMDQFTYSVTDGQLSSAPIVVTVEVAPVNDRPVAADVGIVTKVGRAVGGTVDIVDADGDTLVLSIVTSPSNGGLMLDSNTGAYTYTPNGGYVGMDSFFWRAWDGNLFSNIATVSVRVRPLPNIVSMFPAVGSTGQPLQLSGVGFGAVAGDVTIGGRAATVNVWADTYVSVQVPLDFAAGPHDVVLTDVEADVSPGVPYSIIPWVAAVDPIDAAPNEVVVLRGDSLGTIAGTATVGGLSATVQSWTNQMVELQLPGTLPAGRQPLQLTTAASGVTNTVRVIARGSDTWVPVTFVTSEPAVWTGTEMLGAYGRYNPGMDTWLAPQSGGPSGTYLQEMVWTGTEALFLGSGVLGRFHYDPEPDAWSAMGTTGATNFHASDYTPVWTGLEALIWGGRTDFGGYNGGGQRYDPAARTWVSLPSAGLAGRSQHSSVWTGTHMIVWGGYGGSVHGDGALYDPIADAWTGMSMTGAAEARVAHTAVWTGTEMIVWGGNTVNGYTDSGARYHPATDSWMPISSVGAPTPRTRAKAVWTGEEMLVWGGNPWGSAGGRYDPSTDSWAAISSVGAPVPSAGQSVSWTGKHMVILDAYYSQGGLYDPKTDTWSQVHGTGMPRAQRHDAAVWTGTELVIWGDARLPNDGVGGRYEPATRTWQPMSTTNAPASREFYDFVWTGTELIVWGGTGPGLLNTGGRYDPSTDTWTATTTVNAPDARSRHKAVWTGTHMIVWGGSTGAWINTGANYDPSTDSWSPVSTLDAPGVRSEHAVAWTGSEMIVWGGYDGTALDTGGRYDPSTDSWLPITMTNAPSARRLHTATWTGTDMIVCGGVPAPSPCKAYDPVTGTWTDISTTGQNLSWGHIAVWTGSDLLVWGGVASNAPGVRYDPLADSWSAMTLDFAPAQTPYVRGVWTGNEMMLWGGGARTWGRYIP